VLHTVVSNQGTVLGAALLVVLIAGPVALMSASSMRRPMAIRVVNALGDAYLCALVLGLALLIIVVIWHVLAL